MPIPDAVAEISTSTGTGNLTLSGDAAERAVTFASAGYGDGALDYAVWIGHDTEVDEWEICRASISSGAIVRGTIIRSSNSDARVAFSAGNKIVTLIVVSEDVGREVVQIACSDNDSDLATGTVATFRMPFAFTVTDVRASVATAPVGSTLVVDVNEAGTSILSTKLSIDAGEETSTTAATPPVISDTALADDAEITIDIDQVGASTAGAGLVVTIIGTRA